ncbi:hypothetical protein AK812_SmicGene6407 [Symbiodinium microadriaticum]|uniref:Ubiquitin-like domain-containing protein n=1 Tax=Symbiodinium microadriaticum TaxID=2951 RepID=A0A1Q9ER50_SYMMI|nr:hypothetical protein AK812_SmicGene6407 [Symbiodinium microadriaticum]
MAAVFTIRLLSGIGFEVELPHANPLAKEVKMAIKEARNIPVYDQRLILDGQELPNFSVVQTDKEILLIIGATNITETVLDFLRNRGAVPFCGDELGGPLPVPLSAKELKKLAEQCRQGCIVAWALGTAMSTTVDSDDDLESIRDSLPPQLLDVILKRRPTHPDLVTRCEEWTLRCDKIAVTEESVQQYLDGLREVAWAMQTSEQRGKLISDPYERDILDLKIGEIPCQAMVDYRERSWSHGLSVEDACAVSRRRDQLVLDRFERDVLDRWERPESAFLASRDYAAACGGEGQDTAQGWVDLLSPDHQVPRPTEAPRKVLVIDACTSPAFVGLIDVNDSEPGCKEFRQLPLPGSASGDWLPVFADLQLRPEDQPVVLVEPMHAKRAWREQGYLLVPAIVSHEDLDPEGPAWPQISSAIQTAVRRCPVETTRSLRRRDPFLDDNVVVQEYVYGAAPFSRRVHLIGSRSSEALAQQLQNGSGGMLSATADGPDAAWRGAAKVCRHPQLQRFLTTREEYLEHGCSAVHRKCL